MSNPFYTVLAEHSGFSESELAQHTQKTLERFQGYLRNTIKILEKKIVSCRWEPLSIVQYRMYSQQRIYEVVPRSVIEIFLSDKGWFRVNTITDDSNLDGLKEGITINVQSHTVEQVLLTSHNLVRDVFGIRIYLPNIPIVDTKIGVLFSSFTITPLSTNLENLKQVVVDGQEYPIEEIHGTTIHVFAKVQSNSTIYIQDTPVKFQVKQTLHENDLKGVKYENKGDRFLVVSENSVAFSPHRVSDVTDTECKKLCASDFSGGQHSFASVDWQIDWRNYKEGFVLFPNLGIQNSEVPSPLYCKTIKGYTCRLEKMPVKEKWIQLIEIDGDDDTLKSTLDYFFDENVTISDASKRQDSATEYEVLGQRFEERQILLAPKKKNVHKSKEQSEYPTTEELFTLVDVSQLKKQQSALTQLQQRPYLQHWPLIALGLARNGHHWEQFQPKNPTDINWIVLKDMQYSGCDIQRDFVCKALATPDFAILDGPPGTGKTTTILELIMQLVLEGKRVLLSASTHAAINNVLERIKDNEHLNTCIFPLRIGDKDNARGVEDYQYDQLLTDIQKKIPISPQILVDSANLVCGTTIGILKLFREKEVDLDNGIPPFDVMIIDECSKTTFQEFLVPALYAKRWILVGDIRQLSPFTDREAIVANLQNMKSFSVSLQTACFLLNLFRASETEQYAYTVPIIMPVPYNVILELEKEISARIKNGAQEYKKLLLVSKAGKKDSTHRHPAEEHTDNFHWAQARIVKEPAQWYTYTCCFVEDTLLDELQYGFPTDAMVLSESWMASAKAFEVAYVTKQKEDIHFYIQRKSRWNIFTLQEALMREKYQRSWAEEVCWRLDRLYWLRLAKKQDTSKYKKVLERLYPKSIPDIQGDIQNIEDLAFPSILEALSGDGYRKTKKAYPTTLNQGFTPQEKHSRHSTLTHQHRMHPDISQYPREQFYEKQSLLDASNLKRDWGYTRYARRSIWIDVKGMVRNNRNITEVKRIGEEIREFCKWASSQEHSKKEYEIAVLTFYKGQESQLREELRDITKSKAYSKFSHMNVSIKLATVDYFQGQEADVVFLSMVNTHRDGFTDSPNRLNVAITRARFQMVIVGDHTYFSEKSKSDDLSSLAKKTSVYIENTKFKGKK